MARRSVVAGPIVFSLTLPSASSITSEASGGTTINYTGLDFGANNANRYLIVVAGARMTSGNNITSMTIDGQAATLVTGTFIQQGGASNTSNLQIWQQTTPNSGSTSGTVSITWNAATARTGVAVYRLISGTSAVQSAAVNDSGAGTTAATNTVTVPAGGVGIAASWAGGSTAAITWTNATSDGTNTPGANSRFGVATVTGTGAVSVTSTCAINNLLSLAAWGP